MEPLGNYQIVESNVATYWVDEDGIIFYNMKSEIIDSLEKAIGHFNMIRKLSNNQKACLIADVTHLKPITKEAQHYFGEQLPDIAYANAIVSNSPLGRMVANLFFLINTSAFPMKTFNNPKDAKAWIMKYKR